MRRFLLLVLLLPSSVAHAGGFVFAGEGAEGLITHPTGYTGTGGILDVEVCIDATAADAAMLEVPVQNVIAEINAMTASTPNLILDGDNDIPAGLIDWQSLALHELGHCTSLAHPNLGVQTGVAGVNTDFTATSNGADNMFGFNDGIDNVIGSSDDQRGDDTNLHWFEINVNNPFMDVANPQASTYSRDLGDLPGGHSYAANASRDVGTLLGFADTEAVMQQGQGTDEDQRRLQADDVATWRFGMTGLDETAGTADDYTLNLTYGGIQADTSGCDIAITSSNSGFGVCMLTGTGISGSHVRITSATFDYNSTFSWHFNQTPTGCGVGDDTLSFSSTTHNDTQTHEACTSITYGPEYIIGASGDVTGIAPLIILENNVEIIGLFTADNSVP